MDSIFNAIVNIAKGIEDKVFNNYADFTNNNKTKNEMNLVIYNFCTNLIQTQFKNINNIKGTIAQDTKEYICLNENGKYIVSYVSIDNIDLLDFNFSVGTIFAIYENSLESKNLLASCYITYGPTFQIVFASDKIGVEFFSFNGEKFIDQESFKLKNKGKINSTAGDISTFDNIHKNLMQSFFNEGYRLRFSNSLCLDTHQILFKKGGIYSSASTVKNPNGTLDLIFEAYPISFIIEHAGGIAIDGKKRIMDIETKGEISKKTPIYFGSNYEIMQVKEIFNGKV